MVLGLVCDDNETKIGIRNISVTIEKAHTQEMVPVLVQ